MLISGRTTVAIFVMKTVGGIMPPAFASRVAVNGGGGCL